MDEKVAAGMALLEKQETPKPEKKAKPRPPVRRIGGMRDEEIVERVAGKGFLKSYIQNCMDSTDAPPVFHLGVGLVILGAAMGNQVRFPSYGHQILYPNIWLVLIAPSGFMRKSTALRLGKSLLVQAVPKRILPDDFTPEKLADILKDESAGIMTISEFTKILQMLDRDYNRGAREMLTELYDSPDYYVIQRKTGGKTTIENAAISLLGATTLDWLEERVKRRDLEGGFLARFLFLPATERGPRVTKIPDVAHSVRLSLRDHLRTVAEMKGLADLSLVEEQYDDWLHRYEGHVERGGMPSELTGVYSRAGVTAKKLAVIFQASLRPGELKVSAEAMENATTLVEYIHSATAQVAGGFADTWFEKDLRRFLTFLQRQGGTATRTEVTNHMRMEMPKLDGVIRTLKQGENISEREERTGERGPATRVYEYKNPLDTL